MLHLCGAFKRTQKSDQPGSNPGSSHYQLLDLSHLVLLSLSLSLYSLYIFINSFLTSGCYIIRLL